MNTDMQLIFEASKPGRIALDLPALDVPEVQLSELIPAKYLRKQAAELPELSQLDVMRHYTLLSNRNFGVDSGFYPLGSCTMKYNPKVNEDISRLDGLAALHPLQDASQVQGAMHVLYEMEKHLAEISGMDAVSMQPAAGAHGELTGMKVIAAYHRHRGDSKRCKVIVPDSAHGTNPATAAMCGMQIIEIKSEADGSVDLEALKAVVGDDTAALMLTNPSTLGLFEKNIKPIAKIMHDAGALLYYDGANANAIMGITRPGDMGFDVIHFNLHKTFATPHGGGGPGSGPIGVKQDLIKHLPEPRIELVGGKYQWAKKLDTSIGKVQAFHGNFSVLLKAYAYILSMGAQGLRIASEDAVLNANYCKTELAKHFFSPFDRYCMHECIVTSKHQKAYGVTTLDIAKRLLDYGYHPPTVYFPLIVEEALMVEPTETESKETLDGFIAAMAAIAEESAKDASLVVTAPHNTVVKRLDGTLAARKPVLKWSK